MDERKLAELFRDAVQDAPPPSFDTSDVQTASRRAAARRRNSIAAGTTLVVVLGFGGVVAGTGWLGTQDKGASNQAVSAEQRNSATDNHVLTAPDLPPPGAERYDPKSIPGTTSTQGDVVAPGSTGSEAGDRAAQGCAAVDRKLADALAVELSVSSAFAELPELSCSPASRVAAYKIDGLTISAIVTPDGFEAPAGAAKVRAASGQDLYVFTSGDGELDGRSGEIADRLAPQF